jgi:protein SCO1
VIKHAKFIFLSVCLILVGFVLVYWLWPKSEGLPVLGKVDNFQLEDVQGETYQLNNGKIKLITFFYTHCPDICPLTMSDFKILQKDLKQKGLFGNQVELVAVTFDPENDDRETIKNYANAFEADQSGWKWLRGTPEKTKQIADEFQIKYKKVEGGFFAHTTTMYLVDKENTIRAFYDMANSNKGIEKDKILEDITLLVEEKK